MGSLTLLEQVQKIVCLMAPDFRNISGRFHIHRKGGGLTASYLVICMWALFWSLSWARRGKSVWMSKRGAGLNTSNLLIGFPFEGVCFIETFQHWFLGNQTRLYSSSDLECSTSWMFVCPLPSTAFRWIHFALPDLWFQFWLFCVPTHESIGEENWKIRWNNEQETLGSY